MTQIRYLKPELVSVIPNEVHVGIVYVSKEYKTAVHKCCCGCGNEVITPLGPTDWKIKISTGRISISPSIGNWSFTCKSHYWINNGNVVWAEQWTERQIKLGRASDKLAKDSYYENSKLKLDSVIEDNKRIKRPGFLSWLWKSITRMIK